MANVTIGFEGLAANNGQATVPNGYKGLNWTNFRAYDDGFLPDFGYVPHAGQAVGANNLGRLASFQATGGDFDLNDARFSAAWSDNLRVVVKAYDDGVLVGRKAFTVDYGQDLLVRFGTAFDSVDRITVKGSRGVDHDPNDDGSGVHVSVDDIRIATAGGPPSGTILATDSNGVVGRINVATGAFTVIGNSGGELTDIDIDADGDMFAISFSTFFSLAPNGARTTIGLTGGPRLNALEVGPDGTFYSAGPDTTTLYTINPATGRASALLDLGFQSAGDFQFIGDTMYFSREGRGLVAVDVDAQTVDDIGSFGISEEVFGLALDANGNLIGLTPNGAIYDIDTATGAATFVADGINNRIMNGAATLPENLIA